MTQCHLRTPRIPENPPSSPALRAGPIASHMDRKSVIILVICGLLFLLWSVMVPKLYPPPQPLPRRTNQMAAISTTNLTPPSLSAATNLPAAPLVAEPTQPSTPEELLVTTNVNARYTFTSHGGGVKLVELEGYPEVVSCREKQAPGAQRLASLNMLAPQAVLKLAGSDGLDEGGRFKLTSIDGGVHAEKTLPNGLACIKEFRPASNYLVYATVRLENRSPQTLALPRREWELGTPTPMNPQDNSQLVGVMWSDGSSAPTGDAS